MAFKRFQLTEQLNITIYKRKASRSMRLSVAGSGEVRLSIPLWVPYRAGLAFAQSRLNWIQTHQSKESQLLTHGQAIGKAHHLQLVAAAVTKPTARLQLSQVVVSYPTSVTSADPAVQKVATAASVRALRTQAIQLLPRRLDELARRHGFAYRAVTIKQLKSRWGSCDQQQRVALNLFLMQLPWDLIDYVLLHELTHTVVLNHSPAFWQRLSEACPGYKDYRRQLRKHKPVVFAAARI